VLFEASKNQSLAFYRPFTNVFECSGDVERQMPPPAFGVSSTGDTIFAGTSNNVCFARDAKPVNVHSIGDELDTATIRLKACDQAIREA
jgi:hypothetical protein